VDDIDSDPAVGQALRARLTDLNDGLIASAGMVEGVAQAHASPGVVLVAGIGALLVGVVAVAGIRYTEASDERDAHDALVEAERRRISADPEAEMAELASIYEAKGLEPALARQVAEQLSARDALTAQLDAEYRIDELGDATPPARAAGLTAAAFVGGATLPLLVASLAPSSVRVLLTALVVVAALVTSAVLAARSGQVPVGRAVARTVGIGVLTMLVTIGAGSLLDLSSAEVEL